MSVLGGLSPDQFLSEHWQHQPLLVRNAVPGGSVGPHFDQYDVFLLQVEGERRWEIAPDLVLLESALLRYSAK